MMADWVRLAGVVALGFWLGGAEHADAQGLSQRPIRIVVPSTAGSPNDIMARLVAEQLSSSLQRPVIVDNRPGAGATIGMRAAAAAAPDGNTLLFISTSLVIDPVLYKMADYDPLRIFTPIATVASTSWVMVVTASVPAASVSELISYAKANPGRLNFGYALGTASQLIGELFKISTGTDIADIPYKGGTGVVPDMLGGRVQVYFGTTATILPLIRAGKLKAPAITSPTRSPQLPEIPTTIESGLSELSLTFWMGTLAPAGTPAMLVDKLNGEINEGLRSAKFAASMRELGFEPKIGTPQDCAAFIADESPKWSAIVQASGAKVD
jgi:tripartite-type tricarboxylate transporter receptor subunit TctC